MCELCPRLNEVFQNCFEDPSLQVHHATTSEDVPGWDSLMHVTLILAVEREFGIRLRAGEVDGMKHVGDLAATVQRHLDRK